MDSVYTVCVNVNLLAIKTIAKKMDTVFANNKFLIKSFEAYLFWQP